MTAPRHRVLHLITTLDPGGAENHLLTLCRALRPTCDLHVAWLKGKGRLAPAFAELGIETSCLDIRGAADPRMPGRVRTLLDRVKPDILHTHLFKADFYGAWAARSRSDLTLVSSKHNQDPELTQPLFGWLGRRALARADGVIAISAAVRQFVALHAPHLPAGQLHLVHYGFDVAAFDARDEPATLRLDLGIPPDAPLALFLGRLEPQKGLSTLLFAAAHVHDVLPRAHLVLVGQGSLEEELRRDIEALQLGEFIHLAGHRLDVRGVLDSCDLLVLPSRWEGFGMVLVEAMTARKPVVGSTAGSIPEVVTAGEAGLLSSPGDAEALGANLLALLADPARAQAMGAAGRRRVEEHFAVEGMLQGTLTVYGSAREVRAGSSGPLD